MAEPEIREFLANLAVDLHVSASTQTVALSALLFLYRDVLKRDLPYISDIERAKPSRRLPVVFSRAEVQAVLAHLAGTNHLIAIVSLLTCSKMVTTLEPYRSCWATKMYELR